MPTRDRRADALSKERIVATAIDILDTDGEAALTFRALTTRLATGAGAIYWHVADKDELLTAATDHVISGVLTDGPASSDPRQAIRELALGMFDAIDTHPWVGAHLARQPWQFAMVQIFEGIGGQLSALGVPEKALFDAGSALVHYILGVAGQNAANARLSPRGTNRTDVLADISDRWLQHDADRYPVVHRMATQLRDHDDRQQFLAGIDFLLAGVTS
ncbi:TetR family transcriptional regulator [Mycobacterium sp. 236(2023)]|uniref:TetR/AcrR family transcriptional regulator n=1 Tax=Mycobacterium sp. 236(2023) TaxID=3038163 RepID=UPI002414DE26|nr:TetR family transcriptional regulator [Mycobacterium sp. 236(2023)]MDG4663464.1 TetR family transcriptional regulator [Mycobacterium sp. 236(2023)]